MRIFKDWFIVKRPYTMARKKAVEFMKQYPPDDNLNDERSLFMRRIGYEDGYATCLKDLGINQTIESRLLNKKQCYTQRLCKCRASVTNQLTATN